MVVSETTQDAITEKNGLWEENSVLLSSRENGNLPGPEGKGEVNGIAAARNSIIQPRLESFARHLANRTGSMEFNDREIATLKFVSSRLAKRADEARR
jgi:hypothetical protein